MPEIQLWFCVTCGCVRVYDAPLPKERLHSQGTTSVRRIMCAGRCSREEDHRPVAIDFKKRQFVTTESK